MHCGQIPNRLLTTSEEHYFAAGSAICSSGPGKYSFWSRYLEIFDEVIVLARVSLAGETKNEELRADGPCVSFRAMPDYTGPWQYLQARRAAEIIARNAAAKSCSYLLRVPGFVSQMVWHEIRRLRKPYAVEVLGDPWEALSPGTWPNALRPAFRILATQQLKRICSGATAVSYVTSGALQKRYAPPSNAYVTEFSDVSLAIDAPTITKENKNLRLRELPWKDSKTPDPIRIGFIGSFARMYKGPDTLLHAAALCQHHLNLQIVMVGAGRYLPEMKTLATRLGIADRVEFRGELSSGPSIFEFLDSIDMFVMPSRAEGLPRALVEAMSRGCPCIGSAVGGIPELLDASDLVPANSPEKLANLILEVAADSNRLLAMSARNLAKAGQFNPETLNRARRAFLEEVKRRSLPG